MDEHDFENANQMASESPVSQKTINRWLNEADEEGDSLPSLQVLRDISSAFDLPLWQLISPYPLNKKKREVAQRLMEALEVADKEGTDHLLSTANRELRSVD
ncbi:MAG: helix-turn-helix transcriptional regulator [Pseudomonadota bacterium]